MDEYDIDCTGTEDEVIAREADKAASRFWPDSSFKWDHVVGPLVRIILAFVAALGAKTLREALARAKGLLAPVDVEKEVEKLNGQIVHCDSTFEVLSVVRPLVTDRARLAREVDGLRVSLDTSERDRANAAHELNEASAEIARLTAQLRATVDRAHADTDALAAELADVRASYQARETDWRAGRVRLDPCETPARLTAAPGEAWERLRRAVHAATHDTIGAAEGGTREEPKDDPESVELRAALAAVEPVVDVTAITHDFRPGAQDGLPRLADVEACETAAVREIVARLDVRSEPYASLVAEHRGLAIKAVLKTITEAEAGRLVDIRAEMDRIEMLAAAPTPPRALTEAEAIRWAARAYPQILHAGHRQNVIAALLLAASRGVVPPEVRPTKCSACDGHEVVRYDGYEMAVTTGETTDPICACGEPLSRHDAAGQYDPCPGGGGQFRDPPAGVPSIAGPAGLDLASGPPDGYWEAGHAVEREVVFVDRREGIVITAPKSPAVRPCIAVLVTDPKGRVALVQSAKPGRGWELSGGGVYDDEEPVDAAIREVDEEMGLKLRREDVEQIDTIHGTPKPGAAYASVIHVFRASAEGDPQPGSDAKEAMWFSANDVLWLDAHHMLSDLASRGVLLAWAGAQ